MWKKKRFERITKIQATGVLQTSGKALILSEI